MVRQASTGAQICPGVILCHQKITRVTPKTTRSRETWARVFIRLKRYHLHNLYGVRGLERYKTVSAEAPCAGFHKCAVPEPGAGAFRPREVRTCRIGLPLAAVCLALFTAACSGQGPADGTVTGHLYGVGGPAPGLPHPWPGTVTLTGRGVHRDVLVGATGAYSVTVPAGSYTVEARSPLFQSGAGLCQATNVATVVSGHSTKADVLCQMS